MSALDQSMLLNNFTDSLVAAEAAEVYHDKEIEEQIIQPMLRDRSPEARAGRRKLMYRAVLGEFIATTLFMFTVCAIIVNSKLSGIDGPIISVISALGTSLIAIANIYAFADVSGAHFNPAVTFAAWLGRKTSNRKCVLYIIAQLAGANLGMLIVYAAFDGDMDTIFSAIAIVPQSSNRGHIFVMEFILTFILVFIIFMLVFDNIEEQKKSTMTFKGIANSRNLTIYTASGNSKLGFAPLAIGVCIGALALSGGVTSGGCFNPARLFSAAVWSGKWKDHWIYWIAELSGGAFAALVSMLQAKIATHGDFKKTSAAPVVLPASRSFDKISAQL